jgi:DNA repair protein RadD
VGDVVELRDYQQRAIDMVWDYIEENDAGNPCVVLPTGAGKSHVIASMCKHAVTTWPGTRIIMATHVKELIEQNAEKMLAHWPGAPLGVYSASLGKRDLTQPITFCGIGSVRHPTASAKVF